jgi:hypothetical protein
MNTFSYRVCGIPCLVNVIDWEPYDPGQLSGPPDRCYPPEGGWAEFELLDKGGRRAEWLERKMKPQDREDVEVAAVQFMNGN